MLRPYAAASLALLLLTASGASAEPSFARLYQSRYGYPPACSACHERGGGSPLGAYGEAFKKAGSSAVALAAIEPTDSDGDGFGNALEIEAKSNPGDAHSTPKSKGDWLDPANLIPKEVQAAFPGIRSYKTVDAILTARELERAAAFGVTLEPKEENTIYLPLDGNEPQGAAILVAAGTGAEPLFLMVAADRKLVVKQVSPIAASPALAALVAKGAPALVGKHVKELPAAEATTAAGRVAAGVRKAGAILYVRLKKE